MGLTFNPFTGTFDFTGTGGGSTPTPPALPFNAAQYNNAGSFGGFGLVNGTGQGLTVGLSGTLPDNNQILLAGSDVYHGSNTSPPFQFSNTVTDHNAYEQYESFLTYKPDGSMGQIQGRREDVSIFVTDGSSPTVSTAVGQYLTFNTDPSVPTPTAQAFYYSGNFYGTHATEADSFYLRTIVGGTATITNALYLKHFEDGGSTTTFNGIYQTDLSTVTATNPYYEWYDSRGVFRIREDSTFNGVGQAILALYNPRFTKYTPGATNFERVVLQWETDVATLTTEKGGTGTLRALNLGDTGTQIEVNGKALTLAGAFTTSGAFAVTQTYTAATSVTFPTSGTLLTTAGSGASLTFPGTLSIASGKVLTSSNTLTLTGTDGITAAFGGGLSIAATKVLTANATLTLTGTDGNTFTFPSGSDTVVVLAATQTLTNKRITKRVVTASDATSVTPNSDNADVTYQLNTQAAGTLTINADAGTPTNGQAWVLKIKSSNVQTFSWNAIYVGGAIPLPTSSSGSSKIDYFCFVYDTVTPKWDYTGTALAF